MYYYWHNDYSAVALSLKNGSTMWFILPDENMSVEELLNDKEKTIATSHDKIMIAKVRKYNFADIEYTISHIINNAEDGNIHDMIYEIKTLIPEYVSANSEYELIDKEINNLKNKLR